MTFDELRQAYPTFAFSIYALTPGGAVTLEIIASDGATYQFPAETLDQAIAIAFPETAPVEPVSIFD